MMALIQPSYGDQWPATITEFHYNNAGVDAGEYIEIHQNTVSLFSVEFLSIQSIFMMVAVLFTKRY